MGKQDIFDRLDNPNNPEMEEALSQIPELQGGPYQVVTQDKINEVIAYLRDPIVVELTYPGTAPIRVALSFRNGYQDDPASGIFFVNIDTLTDGSITSTELMVGENQDGRRVEVKLLGRLSDLDQAAKMSYGIFDQEISEYFEG